TYIQTFKFVHMDYVWTRLSQTLTITVTLDAIIQDNTDMKSAWEQYKKMIGYVRGIPEKMGISGNDDKLNDFQHQMMELENSILKGTIYERCIQQKFGVISKVPYHLAKTYEAFQKQSQTDKEEALKQEKKLAQEMEKVTVNRALYEEVLHHLRYTKTRIRNELEKQKEFHHRDAIVDMFALYGLVNFVFKHVSHQDKVFYKECLEYSKKVGFIFVFIPYIGKEKELDPQPSKIIEFRRGFLQAFDDQFNEFCLFFFPTHIYKYVYAYVCMYLCMNHSYVQHLYIKMCEWMIQWDTDTSVLFYYYCYYYYYYYLTQNNTYINMQYINSEKDIMVTLRKETHLLIDGLVLASQIQNTLTTQLFLHLNLEVNFRQGNLRSLSVCGELLKSIEGAFHRKAKRLSANVSYMLTVIAFSLQKTFDTYKKKIAQVQRPSTVEVWIFLFFFIFFKKKKKKRFIMDCLAALGLCSKLLNTAPTLSRLVVLNISSCICAMSNIMRDDVDKVKYTLWKLDTVANWQHYLRKVTDCSVFYWALSFIPNVLRDIFDTPDNAYRLPAVFGYLNDSVPMLKQNAHEEDPEHVFQVYSEDVLGYLDKEIINELCNAIENDLRLQVMNMINERHAFASKSGGRTSTAANMNDFLRIQRSGSVIDTTASIAPSSNNTPRGNTSSSSSSSSSASNLPNANSANKGGITGVVGTEYYQSRKDYGKFILLKPFRVLNELVDIKKRVEHYLNKTFYNMATVVTYKKKKALEYIIYIYIYKYIYMYMIYSNGFFILYAEMKSLAKKKYGLDLVETHLPTQSHFSEGLDVLEVMRNIHLFVSRYNYNLNMQIFVERAFDQLHLNAFDVAHVANSIRTHGPGIVSTAVNFAYQFCASKFVLFHEFLYDDHIKSQLIRDVRLFRDKKQEWNNRYPFVQAKQFVAMIRTFGEDGKGQTFLDHFRALITQIGNALGYVRMIRSGLLYYTSSSMEYVPDVDDVPAFADHVKEASLSSETAQASEFAYLSFFFQTQKKKTALDCY
ncbi:hypothetical protein RFI_13827, partial [Reticulomyxa filosa]